MAVRRFSMAGRASSKRRRQLSRACGGQVEKVGAANPGGRGPGELPREQIDQGGKLPLRRTALLGIGQGGKRIDEEDVPGLIPRFQALPPVVANIGVLVGMGLHEDQPRPRGGGGKFLGHAGTAVLLLRGGHDQARRTSGRIRRNRASVVSDGAPGGAPVLWVRVAVGSIGRIGVGAIDENQVRQRRARSCWIRSISRASMPKISGVSPGRQSSAGRVVVGRPRPERTSSAPARALISELLPVPVPPNVATMSGDSRRTRSEFSRPASRPMIAWHVSAGRHGGAKRDQSSKRLARASISARSSRWARSPVDIPIG